LQDIYLHRREDKPEKGVENKRYAWEKDQRQFEGASALPVVTIGKGKRQPRGGADDSTSSGNVRMCVSSTNEQGHTSGGGECHKRGGSEYTGVPRRYGDLWSVRIKRGKGLYFFNNRYLKTGGCKGFRTESSSQANE